MFIASLDMLKLPYKKNKSADSEEVRFHILKTHIFSEFLLDSEFNVSN